MRRTTWRSWLPLLLFVLSVVLLILQDTGLLTPFERYFQYITVPLQQTTVGLVEGVGDLFKTVRDVRELEFQVEQLENERDALRSEVLRLQQYQADALTLRELFNFRQENPTWGFVGADVVGQEACLNAPCGGVIGQDPNPYLRYLTIDVGSLDGVEMGMPVITSGNILIGRAAEVGRNVTKVQLLNDVASSVAVRLQQSRSTGIIAGQADGSLRLVYVPQDEELQVGETALTSGLGGVLPRGLVVGQVAQVFQSDSSYHQEAIIRPALDYRQVELVVVITSFQPTLPEEIEEPGSQP